MKLILTKTVQTEEEGTQTVLIVRRPLLANYRGCPAYKDQAFIQLVVQNEVFYASIIKEASPPPPSNTFNFTTDQTVSLVNFLKSKSFLSYPTRKLGNKAAKTNPEKAQLFAKSVERNLDIESHLFRKFHFDRIKKFAEAHSYHFTPLHSLNDNVTDTDNDSDPVADVDPDTLIGTF